jgi:predicted molibdopterin-dependent oxidoreductase YjgC
VQAFGSGAMTNSIEEIRDTDCILITGSNTAESHPVISYEVIRAVRNGANLVLIDPRRIPMAKHATKFLQVKPGTDIYVFLAMMHVIVREGWLDEAFITERTENYDEFEKILEEYPPERAALMSGVDAGDIIDAARIYASGERVHGTSIYDSDKGHSAILYAMGITQRSNGTDMVMTLANMAMLCGQVGRRSTGVNPLRGQSNVQGACDLGCLVNVLPGYQQVTDDEKRPIVARQWGVENLPDQPGLTIVEATRAAHDGEVRAVYVMGENPMMSDPNTQHVESAFRKLDLMIVQDIFPSETAFLAHVLFPAAASLEKAGSFTNSERRIQRVSPIIPAPGEAQPDWWIVGEVAARFDERNDTESSGPTWRFACADDILKEVATVTPIYAGITPERIDEGLQWPCPTEDHPGTPILHVGKFSRGRGKFHAIGAKDPAEQTDEEYPLILSTGRVLYHYHSGTMTRRSGPLDWVEPNGFVEIHPDDAAAIDLKDGYAVVIQSRRGEVRTRARINESVLPGTIFLAFHWREAPANMLTQDFALDPTAKIPEYKVAAVRLVNPRARTRQEAAAD